MLKKLIAKEAMNSLQAIPDSKERAENIARLVK
jgi:hypothetical protein